MIKTNKKTLKRFRITKKGKAFKRKMNQNHFNAKESGQEGQRKRKDKQLLPVDRNKLREALPIR